jgi:hypothetical protein
MIWMNSIPSWQEQLAVLSPSTCAHLVTVTVVSGRAG